jgi:ech hydrogenase subunit D
MLAEQRIELVAVEGLVAAVRRMREQGYRLVQICATRLEHFELTYSFAKGTRFDHLRLTVVDPAAPLPSITDVYFGAFAYENELHDLFGLHIVGIGVDYQGGFLKTYVETPFAAAYPITTAQVPHG